MTTNEHPPGALAGIIVLELGSRVGASVCGALLTQIGATVICVERPQLESAAKRRHRTQLAAGKLSFVPDGAADDAVLAALVRRCDVTIVSSDLDPDPAPPMPEGTILCDVSAFGSSGPMAGRPWTDLQIQAVSGVLDATGHADGPPMPIAVPLIEQIAGVYAAAAVLAALRVRRLHGAGQAVEVALYDVAFSMMTSFLPTLLNGAAQAGAAQPGPARVGNRQTMVAPWNAYRADDGWLLLCAGSDEQWGRICGVIGRPELAQEPGFARTPDRLARVAEVDAILGAWISPRTVAACMTAFGDVGIACGPVVGIEGHPREANLLHRGMIRSLPDPATGAPVFVPGSPLRMSRSPGRTPDRIPALDAGRETVMALARQAPRAGAQARDVLEGALAGVRVIEIGHYTTAPLAARLLAHLGAEVIKIESPEGEAVRRWPPARGGQGLFFTFQNADKSSVVLDLASEADRVALRALLATADVLIENLKPGALARRGFSPDAVLAINPRLVSCAVSGFGADSLYAGRPAFDAVIQAMSGLMDVVAGDGEPLKTGPSSADILGGAMALTGILAALEDRDRTGHGQHLDLSMQDIGAWATQARWNDGRAEAAAASVIRCSDGFVAAEDKPPGQSATLACAEMVEQLGQLGIAAAPVLGISEVVRVEQTAARRLWFPVERDGMSYPLLASPLRLRRTPARVERPGPALGQDTERVLAEVLVDAEAR